MSGYQSVTMFNVTSSVKSEVILEMIRRTEIGDDEDTSGLKTKPQRIKRMKMGGSGGGFFKLLGGGK